MDPSYTQHGAVSWTELMTTDVPAAKEFYGQLFGWTFKPFQAEGCVYEVAQANGLEKAGLMPLPPSCANMPPCWGSYVTVNDVNETAKLVEELGGKVLVGPQDIPKVGRFCVIQDPQGAIISAITYCKEACEAR
jgi:predicted enzyme related to lactoylglutathione lyase